MNFKEYIAESELTDLHAEVAHHLSVGQIVNPRFQDLKYKTDRHAEKKGRAVFEKHCAGSGTTLDKLGLGDLIYATPSNLHDVGSLGNKLKKVKENKDHPFYQDMVKLHQELQPLHDSMKQLKGMVVKTTALRAAKKEVEVKAQEKRYTDQQPLVTALTQHLEAYKDRAHEAAGQHYDHLTKELKPNNYDLDKVAPRPKSNMSTSQYRVAAAKRNRLEAITDNGKPTKKHRLAHQEEAKQQAHDVYMAWVNKLTQKIGKPVIKASVTGDPWTGSRLNVHTHDGEEQNWNTKMILNFSKYNKMFNQFPTRKAK